MSYKICSTPQAKCLEMLDIEKAKEFYKNYDLDVCNYIVGSEQAENFESKNIRYSIFYKAYFIDAYIKKSNQASLKILRPNFINKCSDEINVRDSAGHLEMKMYHSSCYKRIEEVVEEFDLLSEGKAGNYALKLNFTDFNSVENPVMDHHCNFFYWKDGESKDSMIVKRLAYIAGKDCFAIDYINPSYVPKKDVIGNVLLTAGDGAYWVSSKIYEKIDDIPTLNQAVDLYNGIQL